MANNTSIDLRELQKQIDNIKNSADMLGAMQTQRDSYIKDFLAWIAGSKTIIRNTMLILSNGAKAVEQTRNPQFGVGTLEQAYKNLSPLSRAAAGYGVSITNNLNRLLDALQPLDVELLQIKHSNPEVAPTADLLISEINAINLLVARFRKGENERLNLSMRTISKWHKIPKLAPQNFNDFVMSFSDSVPALKIAGTLSEWKRVRQLPWAHVVETLNHYEKELGEFLIEYDAAIDMIRVGIQETDVFIKQILDICKTLVPQAQEILRIIQAQTR
jgi:hypothetical protein